jgi:hypothetical protein
MAYNTVPDAKFKMLIENKEDAYDHGMYTSKTQLMDLAQNKYQLLINHNEWNLPMPDQEKIIALEAAVVKFKKALWNKNKNKNNGSS